MYSATHTPGHWEVSASGLLIWAGETLIADASPEETFGGTVALPPVEQRRHNALHIAAIPQMVEVVRLVAASENRDSFGHLLLIGELRALARATLVSMKGGNAP